MRIVTDIWYFVLVIVDS